MKSSKFKIASRFAALVSLPLLGSALAARADHVLVVAEQGGPIISIADNSLLDSDVTPGVIQVNTGALNAMLHDFSFTTLGSASINSGTLSQSGSVTRSGSGNANSVTITAYDTDFLFPAGNPKSMTTSSTDTFGFTSQGDLRTFQSLFNPTNTAPPITGTFSPLFAFIPPTGPGPFNTSNVGFMTSLGSQPTPFALSNTTVVTLLATTSGAATDQFFGTTMISAPDAVTPLPSVAASGMILLGGLLGLGRSSRRSA